MSHDVHQGQSRSKNEISFTISCPHACIMHIYQGFVTEMHITIDGYQRLPVYIQNCRLQNNGKIFVMVIDLQLAIIDN